LIEAGAAVAPQSARQKLMCSITRIQCRFPSVAWENFAADIFMGWLTTLEPVTFSLSGL
jgi:hypothetical protein